MWYVITATFWGVEPISGLQIIGNFCELQAPDKGKNTSGYSEIQRSLYTT